MPLVILPPFRLVLPTGYTAHSGGDDYAASNDASTWPTGRVSMNTTLFASGVANSNIIFDVNANVWLMPSGGLVRSTDAIASSWTSWSGPGVGGFGTPKVMIYDFHNDRLVAVDTTGVVAYASAYNASWTASASNLGSQISRIDISWVGSQTNIVAGGAGGTFYSLNGGTSWTFVGGATGDSASGLCFNPVTDTWWNWENGGQVNQTASNDITVPQAFLDTGDDLVTGNAGGLICNPDTGTMIAVDSVGSRSYWRWTTASPSVWTLISSGNGLPLTTIRSLIFDRTTSRWILGAGNGRVYTSIDDGLTFSVQNGGAIINDGVNFFTSVESFGYAQRYLSTHIVP